VYKSGGRHAAGRLAYITGGTLTDKDKAGQQLQYLREGREDLIATQSCNLPAWCHGDAHGYFRAAEQYEGGGAKRGYNAFEEWKIALPSELSQTQNLALVQDLIAMIAGDRLPCTWAFHEPRTMDGTQPQPHIHLLLSTRQSDGIPRTAATHFKRYNRQHPERGGAQKDPAFRVLGSVKTHRLMVADTLNIHLESHGLAARVHPDTLASRGIARTPEPKLLPSESAAYKTQGVVSAMVGAVLGIRAVRAQTRTREENTAYAAWEQRKAFLGITRDMLAGDKIGQLLLRRHGTLDKVPAPYRQGIERRWETEQEPRERRYARGSLHGALVVLARRLGDEEQAQGGLQVRLPGIEDGRGEGY
jgi:MobA/MobL family